jgi:8-oxo-dGTP diphosphatase
LRLNPHISVDCVIFGFDLSDLKVLLIERKYRDKNSPDVFLTDLKLPGSLIDETEDLDDSASRTLTELTGLENIYMDHFDVFGSPSRLSNARDVEWLQETSGLPIERVVTIAYYSLIKIDESSMQKMTGANNPRWVSISQIPQLAFDHNKIIERALTKLQKEIKSEPIGFELLPKKFTIYQMQHLFEVILQTHIDNRNFRKKLARMSYIVPLNEKQTNVAHKPAQLFKFDRKAFYRERKESFALYFTK